MPENQFFFVKKLKLPNFFLHISSSYAKILGETNFQPQEFHRRREKTEREEVSVNNGQLRIANATPVGARKPPGPIRYSFII